MAWHSEVYKTAATGSKIGAQRRMIREESAEVCKLDLSHRILYVLT